VLISTWLPCCSVADVQEGAVVKRGVLEPNCFSSNPSMDIYYLYGLGQRSSSLKYENNLFITHMLMMPYWQSKNIRCDQNQAGGLFRV
jgi:hypothetical protein